MVGGRFACQHGVEHRRQALGLLARPTLLAVLELGQHLAAEQLEALHDVLVAVAPRLAREDHLVDAVALVAPQVVADLGGRADRKSTRLNSSHQIISYAVFCLKKKTTNK